MPIKPSDVGRDVDHQAIEEWIGKIDKFLLNTEEEGPYYFKIPDSVSRAGVNKVADKYAEAGWKATTAWAGGQDTGETQLKLEV